jgi:hypothetical protein
MPCSDHAVLLKATAQHSTARPSLDGRAVLWPREERHGRSMAWHGMAWHGNCESDTAALCKSNGKDTFSTLSGTAWHGNGILCVNRPLASYSVSLQVLFIGGKRPASPLGPMLRMSRVTPPLPVRVCMSRCGMTPTIFTSSV